MKTTATCGGCHTAQFTTYRDTFHAQVSALGYIETARCWDCHAYHDVLPASDPKSTIAAANLPATCGKCHAGANAGFVKYDPHADSHDKVKYPLLHYAAIFMNLLLSGVLGFFALHTIAWFVRSRFGRREVGGTK
jgi:nitrate/TMAO reductase-like tetraheme cytochrome c subunit